MVPSPDSILVLSWPRALRFGWRSTAWSATTAAPMAAATEAEAAAVAAMAAGAGIDVSCGEKILASPHGAVFMYRWKRIQSWT